MADLIIKWRRALTRGQIRFIWEKFQNWLASQKDERLNLKTVLKFLAFQALHFAYSAGTISSYESSLAVPLQAAGLDLNG